MKCRSQLLEPLFSFDILLPFEDGILLKLFEILQFRSLLISVDEIILLDVDKGPSIFPTLVPFCTNSFAFGELLLELTILPPSDLSTLVLDLVPCTYLAGEAS